MKTILALLLFVAAATPAPVPAPAPIVPTSVSVIFVNPGTGSTPTVMAIENGPDGAATYSVYSIAATPMLNSAGQPMTNATSSAAYAFAQAQGWL